MHRPRGWRRPASAIALLIALTTCQEAAPTASSATEADEAPGTVTMAAATPAAAPRRPAPTVDADLQKFFEQLLQLETGRIERLRILHLGDSHTAGDPFPGRLRALFQQRFGNAGRGMIVPGQVYDGLRFREIGIQQSKGWTVENSLRGTGGPYGLSGFVARGQPAGAALTIAAKPEEEGFDAVAVEYLREARGGRITVRVDGNRVRELSTSGPDGMSGRLELAVPRGSRMLEIVTSGPVALIALTLERSQRGIVYDSFGVSGATMGLLARWDDAIVRNELQSRQPALVILAYGTNEGFQDFDPVRYDNTITAEVTFLRSVSPQAAIVLAGPPDAQRVVAGCRTAKTRPQDCPWQTPAALAQVRETQRAAARNLGLFFWDWRSVMSGRGGIADWVRANPPLARADHVHLTPPGYEQSAEALFVALMERYDAFKAQRTAARPRPRT